MLGMRRIIFSSLAIILILVGLVVLPLPIPLGAIMIACGLILLISVSATAAWYVRNYRQHHPRTDKIVRAVEERLPDAWKKVLKRTDP